MMRGVMMSRQPWSGDYDVVRRDGRIMTALVTNTPVFGKDGNLVAVIGSSIDVTERKTAEAAARRLAAIVDGSGDAILGTTNDGTVTSWNPAAEDLFGYTAHDMIGQSISLIAPDDKPDEQAHIRARLVDGGGHERVETTRRRKDGSIVDVLITASASKDESGNVVGLSVIAQDTTQRVVALRALEASGLRLAEAQGIAHLGSFEFEIATGTSTWSDEYYDILGIERSADTQPRAVHVVGTPR